MSHLRFVRLSFLLAVVTASVVARAEGEAGAPILASRAAPAPLVLLRDLQLRAPVVHVGPGIDRPVDLNLHHYVGLAVHGDGQPGLSTFLGTSTAALGGFRLRF